LFTPTTADKNNTAAFKRQILSTIGRICSDCAVSYILKAQIETKAQAGLDPLCKTNKRLSEDD
jgi:hypothetical protein